MTVRTQTEVFICAALAVIILWDVYAVLRGGSEATISRILYDVATAYPIIPFAVGILIGHLWASQKFK